MTTPTPCRNEACRAEIKPTAHLCPRCARYEAASNKLAKEMA